MITTDTAVGNLNSATDLFADCWAIPYQAEREGPHAQTLGAIERLAKSGTTFAPIATIGEWALLPPKTVQRHLVKLIANGWIVNRGRHHRRTATIQLTNQFYEAKNAGKRLYPRIHLPGGWACRAVMAYIANAQFAAIAMREEDELSFEVICRRIKTIADNLGLSVNATKAALFLLRERGWIEMQYYNDGTVTLELADVGFRLPKRLVKSEV